MVAEQSAPPAAGEDEPTTADAIVWLLVQAPNEAMAKRVSAKLKDAGLVVKRYRPPPKVERSDGAQGVAEELLERIRALMDSAEDDDGATYREKASMISSATGACRLLARLSGQLEVTETQVLRSVAWKRIERALNTALQDHPDVALRLATLLADAESGMPPSQLAH